MALVPPALTPGPGGRRRSWESRVAIGGEGEGGWDKSLIPNVSKLNRLLRKEDYLGGGEVRVGKTSCGI